MRSGMLLLREIVLLLTTWSGAGAVVSLEKNAYRGIVVAIHSSVPESTEIVENLKSLFTSASSVLHRATNQRAYFGEVTIVIPPEWSPRPEYQAIVGGNRFSTAEVRIDKSNPEYGHNPYTLQAGSCGEPGQYIHLTDEFIRQLHGTTTEEYGDPGKTLVHEWAHLRYGVFDEYGDRDDFRTPAFYVDEENKVRPTGCSSDISGWLQDEAAKVMCRANEDGLPDENCHFIPDYEQANEVHPSLMYMHWMPSAEGFCGESETFVHNREAPNKQNLMCKGQSTWEVISQHADFVNDTNPPRALADTTPEFRVLQPPRGEGGQYVLTLDVSGSMSGRRIHMLHRAAARFVRDQIPDRSHLGIVQFSSEPHVLADLTLVTPETRESLFAKLPVKDDGGNTGIGLALRLSLKLLMMRNATEGGVIILITDGEENNGPSIADVMQEVVASRVIIHTIAFGADASKQLEKIIRLTGGRGYFYSDEELSNNQGMGLETAFFAAASTQADVELQPVEVSNRVMYVEPDVKKSGSVIVDKAIGRNTRFLFANSFPAWLSVSLTGPDNTTYTESSRQYRMDNVTKSITFTINEAKPGRWTYEVHSRHPRRQGVGISVTSEANDVRKQPIRIRAWISDVEFKFPDAGSRAKVYAEVKKKYKPVVGATVIATIERPSGDIVHLQLHDEGSGADVNREDGIYSGFFTEFNGVGRYSVTARVMNDGKAMLKVKQRGKSGAMRKYSRGADESVVEQLPSTSFDPDDLKSPIAGHPEEEYVTEPVEEFERSLTAGAFRLEEWQAGDVIPPNRVVDLQVEGVSLSNRTVTLSWTAPGDDMETGNATETEMRFYPNAKHIWHNFNSSHYVIEEDVVDGTLSPMPAGERHHVTIRVRSVTGGELSGSALFFALRCYDEERNAAEVSNVALAYFHAPSKGEVSAAGGVVVRQRGEVVVVDDTESTETASVRPSQAALIAVAAIVVVCISVAFLVFVIIKRRQNELYNPGNRKIAC